MDPSEYYEYEDRAYISPTLSRDEQMSFVDTLRDTVEKDTAQINAQTQALGTDIPSNLGGLTGSEGYFAQRYQTTPVEAQVKALKATAQAKALNDLMTNYQSQVQNRYNQAYRNYSKRAGGAGAIPPDSGDDDDPFDKAPIDTDTGLTAQSKLQITPSGKGGTIVPDVDGYAREYDANGNITATNNPNYAKASDGYYYNIANIGTPIWAEALGPTLAGSGVSYEQWLYQWKANQAAEKSKQNKGKTGGGIW